MMGAGQLSPISAARRRSGSQRFDTKPANLGTLLCLLMLGPTEIPYSLRGCLCSASRTLQSWQRGQQPAGT